MSRIHDALKKAEQDRSIFERIGIDIEAPAEMPVAGPIPVTPATDTVRPQMPAVSSISDPITLDAVSTRSAPTVWAPDTKTMLFFGSEESTHGTEQFRALRSQLYQLREKQPLRKILVTSSVPGEGRSFVAANLAQVMARQPGCRALLIDADLRNPSLHLTLGTSASPGLSEYLLGEADESGIIQRGQMENLFFLASGRPVSGPTEIISNGRLKSIMDCLETLFDWIIIDSPAAIPVSDSGLIANLCDGVLMVVRSNATPFDLVRKARQKFNPDRLLGVVLNGVPPEIDPQIQY
ncbi:MAG: CpsD/CapB family tyrosine-protein kinase [Candidatus Sulfotelmatobacter sp.]